MTNLPLFRIRSWNIGMHCMSFYILIDIYDTWGICMIFMSDVYEEVCLPNLVSHGLHTKVFFLDKWSNGNRLQASLSYTSQWSSTVSEIKQVNYKCWSIIQGQRPEKIEIHCMLNTLMPEQNGWNFADDIFKHFFLNENFHIFTQISLNLIPKVPIDNA